MHKLKQNSNFIWQSNHIRKTAASQLPFYSCAYSSIDMNNSSTVGINKSFVYSIGMAAQSPVSGSLF